MNPLLAIDTVAEVTTARQFPLAPDSLLDESISYDPVRDLNGNTVTIYPPDVVVIKRFLHDGYLCLCRFAGGPLCIIAASHLKPSEVKFS